MSVLRAGLAVLTTALMIGGCSLLTSWDELPLGPIEGETRDATPPVRQRDATRPEPAESGTPADAAAEDAVPEGCTSGSHLCGSRVDEAASDLFHCIGGRAERRWTCTRGCVVRGESVSSDRCACFVGGLYCGEDQVIGDRDTLYQCTSDFSPKLVRACANGCVVNPGADDACR